MNKIRIEKVTLNIGVGKPGDALEKAMVLLKHITGSNPIKTKTMKRIPTWGLRPNLEIGCKVTLRKNKAEEILPRLFKAISNKLRTSQFDKEGNFSFGVPEYIDIPGAEYDPKIGIIGLEAAVTLEKPGFRIKRRRLKSKKIPAKHKISQEEAINFVSKKFDINISSEVE